MPSTISNSGMPYAASVTMPSGSILYAVICCSNDVTSTSFATPATSQMPDASSRTARPSHGITRSLIRRLEQQLVEQRVGLLAVARPGDHAVRVDDVKRRIRLDVVGRADRPAPALLRERPLRLAWIEQRGEGQPEVAVVGEHAGRGLGIGVDRYELDALGLQFARHLGKVR